MTKTPATTDVVDDPADVTSECPPADRAHWYTIAKAEQAAVKAWKQGGEIGERPATPSLDEMTAAYEAAGCAPGSSRPKARSRKTSTKKTTHPLGVFVIDGKPQAWKRPYRLSNVAWNHTAGVESAESARMTTSALSDLLTQLGVEDVDVPGWSVQLPNGKTIAYVADSEDAAAVEPVAPPVVEQPKKKAPAKKAAAPKKTITAKKASAAKAPTKKTAKMSAKKVTPRFKGNPTPLLAELMAPIMGSKKSAAS